MSGRIINKLQPQDEGTLYPSLEDAQNELINMLRRFEERGYKVARTEDVEGFLYHVSDSDGKPIGQYYVE